VRDLQLKRPIYQQTAAYGHFGRELADFEWEKLSRLSEFSAALGR
jgi:S-adenosylmethionine synthetase